MDQHQRPRPWSPAGQAEDVGSLGSTPVETPEAVDTTSPLGDEALTDEERAKALRGETDEQKAHTAAPAAQDPEAEAEHRRRVLSGEERA